MQIIRCLCLCVAASMFASAAAQTAKPPADDLAPGGSALIQPEELAKRLQSQKGEKPLMLQVGSQVMFAQAHIPGSEYVGAGSRPEGLEQLRARVKSLPHSHAIILYCGCCPWDKCPNIRPAYAALRTMGFTNVKALYIADNFGANWVDKGYPVAKGR